MALSKRTLIDARGGTARDHGRVLALGGDHVDLDGGVATRVEDLTRLDGRDSLRARLGGEVLRHEQARVGRVGLHAGIDGVLDGGLDLVLVQVGLDLLL